MLQTTQNPATRPHDTYDPGDRVVVVSGLLEGIFGTVVRWEERDRRWLVRHDHGTRSLYDTTELKPRSAGCAP
jgi:hypothetical protein